MFKDKSNPTAKIAWCAWLVFTLIIVFFVGHSRTTSITLWQAAHHWMAHQPLYDTLGGVFTGGGFIYLPQSAILYTPFGLLPFAYSEALWRVLSLSVFACGLFRFTQMIAGKQSRRLAEYFLIATALSIPLCFDSARNGQMHLLMTGLLMQAAYAITIQQWSKTAFLIVLAFLLKPTAIVFLLLIAGLFCAEAGLYFLLWLSLGMLLPFMTQSWAYAWSQMQACFSMLMVAANPHHSQDWAQFFNLIAQTGWEMPHFLQNIVRISWAWIVLCLGYCVKKHSDLTTTALWLLMLAMIYLMLFNPRTENNDYMMLAPVLSYCFLTSLMDKKMYRLSFLIPITLGLVGSYYLSGLFHGHRNWAAPLMGTCLLGYLISCLINLKRSGKYIL